MPPRAGAKTEASNFRRESKEFGLVLKNFRRRLGLSLDDFAADVGSSSLHVLKAEAGLEECDMTFLAKCAEAFNLELAQVLPAAIAHRMKTAG
jgi:hypothetical protein